MNCLCYVLQCGTRQSLGWKISFGGAPPTVKALSLSVATGKANETSISADILGECMVNVECPKEDVLGCFNAHTDY